MYPVANLDEAFGVPLTETDNRSADQRRRRRQQHSDSNDAARTQKRAKPSWYDIECDASSVLRRGGGARCEPTPGTPVASPSLTCPHCSHVIGIAPVVESEPTYMLDPRGVSDATGKALSAWGEPERGTLPLHHIVNERESRPFAAASAPPAPSVRTAMDVVDVSRWFDTLSRSDLLHLLLLAVCVVIYLLGTRPDSRDADEGRAS